jgi:uncharacterized protein DUF1236
MNNNKLMIAVATAALIAGTTAVFAQQQGGAGSAPAGQAVPKSSGQTTGQPAAPGGMQNGAETKGGKNAAEERGEQNKSNRAGEAQPNRNRETTGAETKGGKNAAEERGEQNKSNRAGEAQPNRNRETTGQAPQNERKETQTNERRENRTEGNKATTGATEERRLEQNRATEERGRDNDRNRTTTGQGAAPNKGNVSVNITPEKRTQIHQVFIKERSAPRVDRVDFDLSVGTAVPRSVRFVAVPSTIIAIEPSWRGYDYFMVGDQIVIVDPRSMEIVAIIDA